HVLAEQTPIRQSRVTLSDRKDALGVPFLDIDLRYSETDARSVLRAHEVLDNRFEAPDTAVSTTACRRRCG
ncbi:hypothetical protein QUT10_22610, partial [Xanthomonas citri pv. citri]